MSVALLKALLQSYGAATLLQANCQLRACPVINKGIPYRLRAFRRQQLHSSSGSTDSTKARWQTVF